MTTASVSASPRAIQIEVQGATDVGRRREHNEDAFGLFPSSRLFIVADGMGGTAGGALAARITVDELAHFFETQRRAPRTPWPFPCEKSSTLGANLLRVGLQVANREVRGAATERPGLEQMGATAVAVALGQASVSIAHLGDARVYRLRDGALERLTRDHTVREELRAAQPDLTEEEIASIPQRDLVTRAVGRADVVVPTVTTEALRRGDLFLLCSDGLWGPVAEQTIADVLVGTPDLAQACETLVAAANEAGGPDNVTVVLVRAL